MPTVAVYILFVVGFVFLIKGADLLVEGASAIARRFKVSDLVIGLTIVSFGTSAPELAVNVIASQQGSAGIALGNILGSNIANVLLILGIASLVAPLGVASNTVWKEIPLSLLAAVMLGVLVNDQWIDPTPGCGTVGVGGEGEANACSSLLTPLDCNALGRGDAFVLITLFVLFMYYTWGLTQEEGLPEDLQDDATEMSMPRAIFFTLLGLTMLVVGGDWIVDGAVELAQLFGLSEAVIGIAVVGVGTSLPEVAASATAAAKGKSGIAIGNAVGSNIFNVFWVLGVSGLIRPIPFDPAINIDMFMAVFASFALFLAIFLSRGRRLYRIEGILFLLIYAGYLFYRIVLHDGG